MTASQVESQCTLLIAPPPAATVEKTQEELQKLLESEDPANKCEALQSIVLMTINGRPLPKVMMYVIKFCINSRDHEVKKMLLLYWEVVEKTSSDGKLLPEMILVCNALRNDLQHPNEYIRGITLRFLCKIKYPEILESLIPSIMDCLKHRHSYVRKNAVITVFEVYQSFKDLIPDAPQRIEDFLNEESNASAKRNAFLMLFHCDQMRAIRFVATIMDQLSSQGDSFQMVFLELARRVVRSNPKAKPFYLRAVYSLLSSNSNTVAYEASCTLLSLSSAPTAVRAAISALCQLLIIESDNNVKLIILNKLSSLKTKHEKILQEKLIDILRVLSYPSLDIQKKALETAVELISNQNIDDVVTFLKKEIVKSEVSKNANALVYRKALVEAIYKCAVKFPRVASSVVHLLLNFVGDENSSSALDVMLFIREIVQEYPMLRQEIVSKLMDGFDDIKSSDVFHAALWILGEYANDASNEQAALDVIRQSIGSVPLADSVLSTVSVASSSIQTEDTSKSSLVQSSKPVVLADGTYAQSSSVDLPTKSQTSAVSGSKFQTVNLRTFLLEGDFYLGTAIANALTKLTLRFAERNGFGSQSSNYEIARTLLYLSSILRLGETLLDDKHIDLDSSRRILQCVQTLLHPQATKKIFIEDCKQTFATMLKAKREDSEENRKQMKSVITSQPDDLIFLRQLKGKVPAGEIDLEDDEADLIRAVGEAGPKDDFASRLSRIFQLTGYSDAIYAEACMTVHEFDIVLDLFIVNQTDDTMQNVTVELMASADMKLVERPQGYTIGPYNSKNVQANIKVSSTESGVIFGNISYDSTATKEKHVIVMNSIQMDVAHYISPATCSEAEFRRMWAEFEWENKVTVNTNISSLKDYLDHLIKITNMKCLTLASASERDRGFLAANLYTRSIFGEDALLNLSIEKSDEGPVGGHIRIRSKTQGIALSLGEKITSNQRQS